MTFFIKKISFRGFKICIFEKKVVPLHAVCLLLYVANM